MGDSAEPMLAALVASTVARRAGVHLLVKGGRSAAARSALTEMGLIGETDRLVRARTAP